MKLDLLRTVSVASLLLYGEAYAQCTGAGGVPFNCAAGGSITATSYFLGGSNTAPQAGQTVRYTGQQILDFVSAHAITVPTSTLLGGNAGTLVPVSVGAGLGYAGGTLAANIGTAGAVLGLLNAGVVFSGNDQFTGGVEIGSPTGGMPGAGTLNAGRVLVNNADVLTAASQQWTAGTVTALSGASIVGTTLTVAGGVGTVVAGSGLFLNAGTAGGTITSAGTLNAGEFTNATTVTPYTLVVADQAKIIQLNAAAPIAATGAIGNGFVADVFPNSVNIGEVRATSGTINGVSTLYTMGYQGVRIVNDGTNTMALVGSPFTQTLGQLSYRYSMMIGSSNVLFGTTHVNAIFGASNTISAGDNSIVGGNFNTSSGSTGNNIMGGKNGAASGNNGFLIGNRSVDWGLNGGSIQGSTAQAQGGTFQMGVTSTGTAAARLTMDGAAAGVTNTGSYALGALTFTIHATAVDRTNGGFAGWTGSGVIAQPTTLASSGTLASGFAFTQVGSVGTFSSIGSFSLAPDTTNGGFNVTYTPGVGNTGFMKLSARIEWAWAD